MAQVKVLMPTYRRPELLRRSLNSLQEQRFTDWRCEIHNDDPADDRPALLVAELNDPRLILHNHPVNLGPVVTMNELFVPTDAAYICLLEDDNWWEPTFLEKMVEAMEQHPGCSVAYTGIRIWQEQTDGGWTEVESPQTGTSPAFIKFPQARHVFDYHHSNCSMIIRNVPGLSERKVPADARIDLIEAIQERGFPHPLLYIPERLANFSLTIATVRNTDLQGLYEHTVLLINSFFNCVGDDKNIRQQLWKNARNAGKRSYLRLIYAGLSHRSSRALLGEANLSEWFSFFLYQLKYPMILRACLTSRSRHPELWRYLVRHTRERMDEHPPL